MTPPPTSSARHEALGPPVQRRGRTRAQVTEAIMAAARTELATQSPDGLSLRAVAREVGLVPSALYRYFGSRQDLLSALTLDSYLSMGRAVTERVDALATASPVERALGAFDTARSWVRDNPREFELMVSSTFGERLPEPDADLALELAVVGLGPLRLYADALAAGAIDERQVVFRDGFGLRPQETEALEAVVPLTGQQVGVVMAAWTMLLGFIALEMGSPLAAVVRTPDQTYVEYCRAVLRCMGYRELLLRS